MSKFLAPIHYNMYRKINKQNEINNDLIEDFGNVDLLSNVIANIGQLPVGELEDVIELDNIHGWLQSQIDVVEKSFSLIIEKLIEKGVSKENLLQWFKNRGKEIGKAESAEEVFRVFSNSFLDGMPCDRAIEPKVLEGERAKWVQNIDVHGKYWSEGGVLYNELRCAWIEGLAENSSFDFAYEDGVYEVKFG